MRNTFFRTTSDQRRFDQARRIITATSPSPSNFLAFAGGWAAAIILADAGVPVSPMDARTLVPRVSPSTNLAFVESIFRADPDSVVGYDARQTPMSVLAGSSTRAARRMFLEAAQGSPPFDLHQYLSEGGESLSTRVDGSLLVVMKRDPIHRGFYTDRSVAPEGELVFLAPLDSPRRDVRVKDTSFVAAPLGLVHGLASDEGLRQLVRRLHGFTK